MESALAKLNADERKLAIIESNSDYFKNYDEEKKKTLAKKIVQLSFFVGIKEPPSIEELKLIVHFLCTKFPMCTLIKLEDSFMRACAGEFGEIEHFQNFSPQYISKIIRAYEAVSKLAIQKYRRKKESEELEKQNKEKAEKYNPVEGIIQTLKTECARHRKKKLQEFNDFDNYSSKWAIDMAQKLGLFNDYDEKKEIASHYLRKLFFTLHSQNKNTEQAIEQYVRGNCKNMEHTRNPDAK
jgi:hypothetical protein